MKRLITLLLCLIVVASAYGQQKETAAPRYVQKRYNIFFRINKGNIDPTFQNNAYTIEKMRQDIEATLAVNGSVPNIVLILSTASPDGDFRFNRWLAQLRAKSTKKLVLEMFPEFKNANIDVQYREEDWDGLRQVLKKDLNFPQREKMLAVLDYNSGVEDKEKALRALKQGWRYLINNHVYALRNSSITLCVVMDGETDEFVRFTPVDTPEITHKIDYYPVFEAPKTPFVPQERPRFEMQPYEWQKMIMAFRTNLITPGLNVGVEVPISDRWSVGVDYWYPWFVSSGNKWCTEQLALFIDGRYWFTGEKYKWTETQKLQGHAIGVYIAAGYYDYQVRTHGKQGEYFNVGVDYTFALPIAQHRLRLEFNIGIGFIYNQYRPYKPSSDFSDLIKDPGIKFRTSNFFGPTRGGVSLVVPILVKQQNYKFKGIKIGGERL